MATVTNSILILHPTARNKNTHTPTAAPSDSFHCIVLQICIPYILLHCTSCRESCVRTKLSDKNCFSSQSDGRSCVIAAVTRDQHRAIWTNNAKAYTHGVLNPLAKAWPLVWRNNRMNSNFQLQSEVYWPTRLDGGAKRVPTCIVRPWSVAICGICHECSAMAVLKHTMVVPWTHNETWRPDSSIEY